MNLMPLANLLQDEGVGVQGETLFVNMLPISTEFGTLLRSPLTGTKINHELPGFFQADFQVVVRAPASQYAAGEALIEQVVQALTMNERQVENQFFNYCRPRTEPAVFPLSKGNLLEFAVQMDCCFVRS
jgi:hypothetical protein